MPSPPTFLTVEVNLSFNIILLVHIHLHGNLIYEDMDVDIEKGALFFRTYSHCIFFISL